MKFRKKAVVIEAFLWTGDQNQIEDPVWIVEAMKKNEVIIAKNETSGNIPEMHIKTLEGTMTASVGDYIIKGVKGEIYPCKPGIFEMTYDENFEFSKDMDHQGEVRANKHLRVNLDTELQNLKSTSPSRERSLAITKLQEGIMWLGMDLKRLNETNPYPDSYNPSNDKIAPTADGMKM